MRQSDLIDYAIEVLTKLLIEQDFKDKLNHKKTYVKKTQCYKDLIELFKEIKNKNILK